MRRRAPFLPSDRAERDRFLKHLQTRPAPERPSDYGRQSPRLLGEIVDGIQHDYEDGIQERSQQSHELWDATPTERNRDD